jgi:hypothetical protein
VVQIKDLKLSLRVFARSYPWRRVDPIPRAKLDGAVKEARVALVSSAGLVAPGDPPFDGSVRGGDFSHRVIAADVDVQSLEEHHRSDAFDHSGIESDRNLGMPLERLRELESEGEIGEVAPRHISFMGSITAPGRLVKRTLPVVADLLVRDQVEVALLVPV